MTASNPTCNSDADTLERDAWSEYLAHTRPLKQERYEEVELWAWRHLRAKLTHVERLRRYDRADTTPVTTRSSR